MLTGSLQGYQSFWLAQNRLDLALEAHVLQKPPHSGNTGLLAKSVNTSILLSGGEG